MRIQRSAKKPAGSYKSPPTAILAKELLIESEICGGNRKGNVDITAILHDRRGERIVHNQHNNESVPGYGLNILLTDDEMLELSAMLDLWKVRNGSVVATEKVEKAIGEQLPKHIKVYASITDYDGKKLFEYSELVPNELMDQWRGGVFVCMATKINECARKVSKAWKASFESRIKQPSEPIK